MGARYCLFSTPVHTGPGFHPSSCTTVKSVCPEGKVTWAWRLSSTPSSAKVKNEQSYRPTSTRPLCLYGMLWGDLELYHKKITWNTKLFVLVSLFPYQCTPITLNINKIKYRVIHKSLRDFRTRLRNNQDRHGRKEHINR